MTEGKIFIFSSFFIVSLISLVVRLLRKDDGNCNNGCTGKWFEFLGYVLQEWFPFSTDPLEISRRTVFYFSLL